MMKALKKLSTLFITLISTMLLVACGAATDGSGQAPEVTDQTKPTIVQTEPNVLLANGGDTVIPITTKKMSFVFSEALDPNSIPADNTLIFIASKGKNLKGSWAYDNTKQPTLTFTFDLSSLGENVTTLPLDETYTLDFANTITDLAGNGVTIRITLETVQTFNINLNTAGLRDKTIRIQVEHGDNSSSYQLTGNGNPTFSTLLNTGLLANTDFTLSIEAQPDKDTFCAFSNAKGRIVDRDTSVDLNCSNVIPYYTNTSDPYDPALDVENWNTYILPDVTKPYIHAGERRKFTMADNYPCEQLAPAVDTLNAFNWACEIVDGQTVIYSTGLKKGKHLSDLLDFANSNWLPNSVSVSWAADGSEVERTVPAIWWNNPVVVPENSTLSGFETIYILTGKDNTDPSLKRAYTVSGRHAALVIDPQFTLTVPPSSQAAIDVRTTATGSWVEGKIDASRSEIGILITGGFYTNVRNLEIYNARTNGIELRASEQVRMVDVISRDNSSNGIHIKSERSPLEIKDPNDSSKTIKLPLFGNLVQNTQLIENQGNGLLVETNAINNRFSGITATNNGLNTGTESSGISLSSNNFLSDSVLTGAAGHALTINGQNNIVTLVNATSSNAEGIFFTASSPATPAAQNNLLASISASSIAYNTSQEIYDSNTQVNIVDASNGDSVSSNTYPEAFTDYTPIGSDAISYLNNAVEPFNDNSGNDNGLCEADETCLFMASSGYIQGSGDLQTVSSPGNIWEAKGITLKEYTSD